MQRVGQTCKERNTGARRGEGQWRDEGGCQECNERYKRSLRGTEEWKRRMGDGYKRADLKCVTEGGSLVQARGPEMFRDKSGK